jgi:peptidoglycan/xylan/chitin deacetylase (PgdA/CDA1 family)
VSDDRIEKIVQIKAAAKRTLSKEISLLSLLYHLSSNKTARQHFPLTRSILITSIDVDVGNHILGEINGGKNDRNVHDYMSERAIGALEETCVPMLISLLEELHVPVTFALRGQLLDVDKSIPNRLLDSNIKFEIAAHGYSHRAFTSMSVNEAEKEMKMIDRAMRKLGIRPESFIFPRNAISHLDLLEEHGYRAYRGSGGLFRDSNRIVRHRRLYDMHPSLFITRDANSKFLMKVLDVSIARRLPLHIWFHPKDLGMNEREMKSSIRRVYRPFFEYVLENQQRNLLQSETMSSAIDFVEKSVPFFRNAAPT